MAIKEAERKQAWLSCMCSALAGMSAGDAEIDEETAKVAAQLADDAMAEYEGRALDGDFRKPFAEAEAPTRRRRRDEDEDEEDEDEDDENAAE